MRAIAIQSFGAPDVLEQLEIDRPAPGPGQVLIEVKASSVNPVDWKMRNGFGHFLVAGFPAVLHPDCAGVVAEVGPEVTDFAVGDAVWSFASGLMGKQGALAEFMPADYRMVAKKPTSLSFVEAASLPLISVTAWLCLLERIEIHPGSTLLIQGGTGGVGSLAIQLAKALLDVAVYATCGDEEKCRTAQALGADKAFNYKTTTVEEMVAEATGGQGFDVVFNTPGQDSIDASVHAARFQGTILDINGAFPEHAPFQLKQLGLLSVFAGYPIVQDIDQTKIGRILTEVAALVDDGRLRPLIDDRRFTFAEAAAAHCYQEQEKPIGKVVLTATWDPV